MPVVSMMETSVATSDEDAAAGAAVIAGGGGGGDASLTSQGGVLGSPGGGGGSHALGSPGSGDATPGVRCEDAGAAVCTNSPNHSNNIPLGIESSQSVSSHSRLAWPVYDSTPSSTVVDHNAGIRSTVAVNLHLPPPPASPTNSIPTAAHSGVN